jgi:hypothetical protein
MLTLDAFRRRWNPMPTTAMALMTTTLMFVPVAGRVLPDPGGRELGLVVGEGFGVVVGVTGG